MARKRLIAVATAISLVVAVPAALAAYPVIDSTAIGKMMEQLQAMAKEYAVELDQLNRLKEQVSFLTDISKFTGELTDSIGLVSRISLPLPNLDRLAAQTRGDMRCLMPDGIKWGIKTKDMNLGSICDMASQYRTALFASPESLRELPFVEQEKERRKAAGHRVALLEDTSSRALAQADAHLKQADELNEAADDLQRGLENAQTLQERTHVEAQVQVAQLRATARQTQLLAQMLKLQAASAVMAGVPADKVKEIEEEADK